MADNSIKYGTSLKIGNCYKNILERRIILITDGKPTNICHPFKKGVVFLVLERHKSTIPWIRNTYNILLNSNIYKIIELSTDNNENLYSLIETS